MGGNNNKYLEDMIDDYLQLVDEDVELPSLINRLKEKQIMLLDDITGGIVKKGDAQELFKVYTQIRKCEERKIELQKELKEIESTFIEFLSYIGGNQLLYERKDEGGKQKTTYKFWLKDGIIQCDK